MLHPVDMLLKLHTFCYFLYFCNYFIAILYPYMCFYCPLRAPRAKRTQSKGKESKGSTRTRGHPPNMPLNNFDSEAAGSFRTRGHPSNMKQEFGLTNLDWKSIPKRKRRTLYRLYKQNKKDLAVARLLAAMESSTTNWRPTPHLLSMLPHAHPQYRDIVVPNISPVAFTSTTHTSIGQSRSLTPSLSARYTPVGPSRPLTLHSARNTTVDQPRMPSLSARNTPVGQSATNTSQSRPLTSLHSVGQSRPLTPSLSVRNTLVGQSRPLRASHSVTNMSVPSPSSTSDSRSTNYLQLDQLRSKFNVPKATREAFVTVKRRAQTERVKHRMERKLKRQKRRRDKVQLKGLKRSINERAQGSFSRGHNMWKLAQYNKVHV